MMLTFCFKGQCIWGKAMLPNFGALEYKLEQSLTLMEKIVFELREIKMILKNQDSQVAVAITPGATEIGSVT